MKRRCSENSVNFEKEQTRPNKDILKLRKKISDALDKEICGNYCLLDPPNYTNPGDHLIWEGKIKFLEKIPFNCIYKSSCHFFNPNKIKKDTIILLHGGGNFGDLYKKHQKLNFNTNLSDNAWFLVTVFLLLTGVMLFCFGVVLDLLLRIHFDACKVDKKYEVE